MGPLNVASLGDSEGSKAVPGFSGCRWGNRELVSSSWERRQVQGGLGIFSASEGWLTAASRAGPRLVEGLSKGSGALRM